MMETDDTILKRENTPSTSTSISSIPNKRSHDEDHGSAINPALNPEFRAPKSQEEAPSTQRALRVKRESLKKREAKSASSNDTSTRTSPERASSKIKKEDITEIGPLRYKLATIPTYSDFKPPQTPGFTAIERKIAPDGTQIQFYETFDHVFNKKSFNYTSAVPDPMFRHSLLFRQSETPPYTARFSLEDSASNILIDQDGKHVTTEKGWRSAKANVYMREGRWYWECKVTCGIPKLGAVDTTGTSSPHVRMGIGRREATLDGPVGFDCYSYGLRDVGGQKIHMSRPKDFFAKGEEIREGDVVGFEINLPSEEIHRKVVNGTYNPEADNNEQYKPRIEKADIIRDRAAIKIKDYWVFEQAAYAPGKELEDWYSPAPTSFKHAMQPCPKHPLVPLRTLPQSSIKVFKNGKLIGTAFEDLFAFLPPASKPAVVKDMFFREGLDDGTLGYYPTVSVFQGGSAEVNFGPEYWFPPKFEQTDNKKDVSENNHLETDAQPTVRSLTERYEEQIVEDIVADLIDEVYFWLLDGGASGTDDASLMLHTGIQLPNSASDYRLEPIIHEE
ncbi:BgTH12-04449 [Blumeria graminis f. sp. triticale]|nr:BgTH12-04449 [Blumeria graminis f. sp. triticale]